MSSATTTRVNLPQDLLLQTVVDGPLSGDWLWETNGPIIVDAERAIKHAEPAALAVLAAWADFQQSRGIEIRVDDSLKSPYGWKFGVLSALAGRPAPPLTGIQGYLPPTAVRRDEDRSQLLQSIGPLLHLKEEAQRAAVVNSLSETLRNVTEHAASERGAYVCCSHFEATDRVSIGVVDTGIGVPATIRRRHGPHLTDAQAIDAAVQWRVTGALRNPGAGPSGFETSNAGIGLFYVRSIAANTGGLFTLVSNEAYVRSEGRDQIRSGAVRTRWKGTVVAISFRPSEAGTAWRRTEGILAAGLADVKRQDVNWGPPPESARVAVITPTVEGFVEDKEQAIRLRETLILPELREGKPVGIDLRRARVITHSFVHALLSEAIRITGVNAVLS